MSTAVLVFTKAPQPGASKTRLIPALGADEAAAAHEVLVLRTLDMTRDLGVAGEDYKVSLWGAVPHPALDLWSDQFALPLHLQAAGDLGQKMLHGFASALDAGADQAVLIGSDCPAMTRRIYPSGVCGPAGVGSGAWSCGRWRLCAHRL